MLDQLEVFQKHVAWFDDQIKTVFAAHSDLAFFLHIFP